MAIRRLRRINNVLNVEQAHMKGELWSIISWDSYTAFNEKLTSLGADLHTLFDEHNWRRIAIISARLDCNCDLLYNEAMEIIPLLTVEESYMDPLISGDDTVILINTIDFSEILCFEASSDIYSLPCLGWVRINDNTIVMAVETRLYRQKR